MLQTIPIYYVALSVRQEWAYVNWTLCFRILKLQSKLARVVVPYAVSYGDKCTSRLMWHLTEFNSFLATHFFLLFFFLVFGQKPSSAPCFLIWWHTNVTAFFFQVSKGESVPSQSRCYNCVQHSHIHVITHIPSPLLYSVR